MQIPSDQGNSYFKICREIAGSVPPAVRPDGLDTDMLGLWNLLELCWQVQIDGRPAADDIVHHLERYCSRGYVKRSETPRAYHHCNSCQHPGLKSPESSFQLTLNSPTYLNVAIFLLTLFVIALPRFTTL
jgi:hypothetical protein